MSKLINCNQLYENKGNKNTDEPPGFFTVVSLAVYLNDLSRLQFLYKNGAKLEFPNSLQTKETQSPLSIAISNANPGIVDFLLEKGITIWDKEKPFACSAIQIAIARSFQTDKESAYYFNLLFNKLSHQTKSEFLEKFKTEYLTWLAYNNEDEAAWTLNFLLKQAYLSVDELLHNTTVCNSAVLRAILLEKILHLNKPTSLQIQFLKNNKKCLNELIAVMDLNLFSLVELEQLSNQSAILTLLNQGAQKKIIETFKIKQCEYQPLTLMLVKKIITFADKQLAETKPPFLFRKNPLQFHIFYQEMKQFIAQVDLRFKKKKAADDKELDFAEIQTLLVIIEDFQQTAALNKVETNWYSPPLQFAVKQLCNTPSLSVLTNNTSENALPLRVDKLPTLNDILQSAVEKYKAYSSVMWADIEKAVKQFPLDEANQAIDFIWPRVKGKPYRDIESGNTESAQKIIHTIDLENYLRKIFNFDEDASFARIAHDSAFDQTITPLAEVSDKPEKQQSDTDSENSANSNLLLVSGFFKASSPDSASETAQAANKPTSWGESLKTRSLTTGLNR